MDDLRVPALEPPEALPEGPLDLPFDAVHLVARDPPLPLQLGIGDAPGVGGRPRCALRFLQLKVPPFIVAMEVNVRLGLRIGGTVAPELVGSAIVGLQLHVVLAVAVASIAVGS